MKKNSFSDPLLAFLHTRAEQICAKRVADALTSDDLWRQFKARVPKIAFEYFRSAADDEISLLESVLAFRQARTTAWGAKNFGQLNLKTNVCGFELSLPVFFCPVGSFRTLWPNADNLASKVAREFETMMCLSTLSGTPMEEVVAENERLCTFQLYLCGGKEASIQRIKRAKAAGFKALMLTIDTAVAGNRANHARLKPMEAIKSFDGLNLSEALKLAIIKLKLAPQMLPRLSWLFSHLYDGGPIEFVNVLDEHGQSMPFTDIGTQLAASAVTWEDLPWIKEAWGDSPLIIKGVHCLDDANKAKEIGASGIIISNHGGRQQDGVPTPLHILQEIAPHLDNCGMSIMVDGGIRRGRDVLIALASGAEAVGLGRVLIAGMGAGGYAGAKRAMEIIKAEFERSMRLVGVSSVQEIRERGKEILCDNRINGVEHLLPIVF